MAQAVASPLLFVPPIGFRPAGTRTLREPVETTTDGTRLMVLAVAAAPDRTDVLLEWERTGDPATCPADSKLLLHTNRAPLENGLGGELSVGATRLKPLSMARRSFHLGNDSIGALDAISFPALPEGSAAAELHLSEGTSSWRVPLTFVGGGAPAVPLAAEVQRDGVVVHATALTRSEQELIVEMEVHAPMQIRQVGAPLPSPARYAALSDEDYRMRMKEIRRVLGVHARAITLEDDNGGRGDEIRRLLPIEPYHAGSAAAFTHRFSIVFEAPSADAKAATLRVPFVDLNDREGSVTADLRDVPLDLALGAHRFRVLSAEPVAANRPRVVLEARRSPGSPRFRHPVGMYGADPSERSWPSSGPGEQVSFDATVGEPPVVTFSGAVLRVDGPLELEIPLA